MCRKGAYLLATLILFPAPLFAGKFNRKVSIGDAAPVFQNLEGVDGKKHNLDDLKDKDVVVVVFTANFCPVASRYEDRIIVFTRKHADPKSKVAVIAISVSLDEHDTLPKMKERAAAKKFNFSYVCDPSQNIGRAYGASHTPEFFVLNKERKIVYMGALDNDMDAKKADVNYLENAVTAVLKGEKPSVAETAALGCGIEYKRK